MLYCLTRSEWISLGGVIVTVLAIVVALYIASSQERKNRKRIEEENKNIGETICALIDQLSSLMATLVTEGYQACIQLLEKDDTSQPYMKLVPMTGIKKLEHFNPDILYRVFKYYKLTGEDYKNFVLSIDDIISRVETGVENYKNADRNAVKVKNEFQENFNEFTIQLLYLIQEYGRNNQTNDPVYIEISKILDSFLGSKESENYNNITFRKNELVNKVRGYIASRTQDHKAFMNIYLMGLKIENIYATLLHFNNLYKDSLKEAKKEIAEDMRMIIGINNKLKEKCK